MPDITGRSYESFVEFLLLKIGYNNEYQYHDKQYVYEQHIEATCYKDSKVCQHASSCFTHSQKEDIPYGPWYDPDFLILDKSVPKACLHVTHWSSPGYSQAKFWRTIEDHIQYKTLFGVDFLSINLIFVALENSSYPSLVRDSTEIIELKGWKPAVGSTFAVVFDCSILFPTQYEPMKEFERKRPRKIRASARERRNLYNEIWQNIYSEDLKMRDSIDLAADLLVQAINSAASPRYSSQVIHHLQDVCFKGRTSLPTIHATKSRYRKGIQYAFILRELVAKRWPSLNADLIIQNILAGDPRFTWNEFKENIDSSTLVSDEHIQDFGKLLASIPIKIERSKPIYLLDNTAGIGHVKWQKDFAQFIVGLKSLDPISLEEFKGILSNLFEKYRGCHGINDVLLDLYSTSRVETKVDYVLNTYVGIDDKEKFINSLSLDLLSPGGKPKHQSIVSDLHNWLPDVILVSYGLGSMQHIASKLPDKFFNIHEHSLRSYAFQGNYSALMSHLLSGVDVGQFFSSRAQFSPKDFYKSIWPLFSECIWEAIQDLRILNRDEIIMRYRYKKAMRIIASPDLEPILYIFRKNLPDLLDGPKLKGAFNQLSSMKNWSHSALTTATSGYEENTNSIIQTQSVFGAKHIADKTREIAARLRSLQIKCNSDGMFEPDYDSKVHYLVIDGDWPLRQKINLYEAGFKGIFEIAELGKLAEDLNLNQDLEK